jgi:hypothetical protein
MHWDAYPSHSWRTIRAVSRRRQKRKEVKERRHAGAPVCTPSHITPNADVLCPADQVRRLTYTRSQAAEALGVSVQTIDRRVVPALETVKTAWGTRLIPVSELERFLAEHTQPARSPARRAASRGRPATVPDEVAGRIEQEYRLGKSLGQIARDLNAAGVRTAQGGRRWWPSTVRSILLRRSA